MGYRPTTDTWMLARPRVKYYGAYPGGFLHRARELLGVSIYDPVLHVCSGKILDYPFRGFGPHDKTVDLDPNLNPDFVMDVRNELPEFDCWGWPAILADPPYSEKDAENYDCGSDVYPNPNGLMRLMLDRVAPGGRVGLLHYKVPRMPKTLVVPAEPGLEDTATVKVRFVALITVMMGFGNAIRAFSVFEKQAPV